VACFTPGFELSTHKIGVGDSSMSEAYSGDHGLFMSCKLDWRVRPFFC